MNSFVRDRSRNRGFTLIELLIVIVIIAILAGLLLPALTMAKKSANRAKAGNMVQQLRSAITQYNNEYGVWPTSTTSATDTTYNDTTGWQNLCIALNGNKSIKTGLAAATTISSNTRQIQFMEFSQKDCTYGGVVYDYPIDPTVGSSLALAKHLFVAVLDSSYDNTVQVPLDADTRNLTSNLNLNTGVAVYSKNGADGTGNAITSW